MTEWASAQWNTTYKDYLKNINDIINRTEENSNQNLIARVLKSILHATTD